MALTTDTMSAADLAAITGNNNNGWGSEGGAYWLLILFLFCFMGWGNGGNWNNAGNGGGSPTPYQTSAVTQADVQRGFDQSAVINGINGLNSTVSNGFANAEVSRCNQQGNILQQMNNNNASVLAQMNNNNSAVLQQLNSMAYNQLGNANNCAAGLADLKYTVSQENAADRNAVNLGLQQLLANQNQNTQAIIAGQTQGIQSILDKLCQQEIEQKNDTIAQLRQQLNNAAIMSGVNTAVASNTQQTGQLIADNAAQTQALVNQLRTPAPVPAYVVPNPSGCNCGSYATGCCG